MHTAPGVPKAERLFLGKLDGLKSGLLNPFDVAQPDVGDRDTEAHRQANGVGVVNGARPGERCLAACTRVVRQAQVPIAPGFIVHGSGARIMAKLKPQMPVRVGIVYYQRLIDQFQGLPELSCVEPAKRLHPQGDAVPATVATTGYLNGPVRKVFHRSIFNIPAGPHAIDRRQQQFLVADGFG